MISQYFSNYKKRATGNVMKPGLNYLTDLIVRPGIEKRLWPLVLYRGAVTPGTAHRLWNFGLLMMAAEAQTLADGIKLCNNPSFSQLCGPVKIPTILTARSFFGRLWDNPGVTELIPGYTDYVRSLGLGPSGLTPVDLETTRANCAPWRKSLHPELHSYPGEHGAKVTFYPYVVHDGAKPDGHDLVALVNKAVPKGLPEHIRADTCQDLIVSILAGEITKDQVYDHVKKYIGKTFKKTEWKWGENGETFKSFESPMRRPSGDVMDLHDLLHDGSYHHWSDEMEDEDGEN